MIIEITNINDFISIINLYQDISIKLIQNSQNKKIKKELQYLKNKIKQLLDILENTTTK